MARTDPGFDLTGLLNGFRPLFKVLQPGDVNKLATSLVKVLQARAARSSSCSPRPVSSATSSPTATR